MLASTLDLRTQLTPRPRGIVFAALWEEDDGSRPAVSGECDREPLDPNPVAHFNALAPRDVMP